MYILGNMYILGDMYISGAICSQVQKCIFWKGIYPSDSFCTFLSESRIGIWL